ncbi:MAG: hypothetical protein J2P31_20805 [Blastocatellia bacterium]|nr:hypothetical protein [Blastocatellia bacterium]
MRNEKFPGAKSVAVSKEEAKRAKNGKKNKKSPFCLFCIFLPLLLPNITTKSVTISNLKHFEVARVWFMIAMP